LQRENQEKFICNFEQPNQSKNKMFFPFKNRGILVPVYLIACLFGVLIVKGLIEYLFDQTSLTEHDAAFLFGAAFIAAGHWTYNTRDSFYVANGIKKRMHEENEFFFLSMEVWAYIYWTIGGFCILAAVLAVLGIVDFS
jgi:hypothetical protein